MTWSQSPLVKLKEAIAIVVDRTFEVVSQATIRIYVEENCGRVANKSGQPTGDEGTDDSRQYCDRALLIHPRA
jgi:hypothetical protein